MGLIIHGDCREAMKDLEDNSIDAVVTDPPYGLGFMGKEWDTFDSSKSRLYDFTLEWAKECFRVLKPGAYILAFAGTRTYHKIASAIEDAGFEVRDMIEWVYGCLSDDTEILTDKGFVKYNHNHISNKLNLYTFNILTNEINLETIDKWFEYEYNDTAYRITSDFTDQIVSRNHNCIVEQNGKLIFKKAEALKQQENIPILESVSELQKAFYNSNKRAGSQEQILLKRVCKSNDKHSEFREKTNKNSMQSMRKIILSNISEHKQTKIELLKTMQWSFKGLGVERTRSKRACKLETTKRIGFNQENDRGNQSKLEGRFDLYHTKRQVCESKHQICEMPERIYSNGKERRLCHGTSPDNSKTAWKEFNQSGIRSSYQSQGRGQSVRKFNVIQNQFRPQEIRIRSGYKTTLATIEEIQYNGIVFCPQTKNGAFIARRNGKIFITGNSGFPKSLNIGKAVDKLQGNEREDVGAGNDKGRTQTFGGSEPKSTRITKGSSDWEGWGTALKPAHEPICMARKPLAEKTVAENCLKWGVGGINIDGSRVGDEERTFLSRGIRSGAGHYVGDTIKTDNGYKTSLGRFPANLIHDGSDEVKECFPNTKSDGGEGVKFAIHQSNHNSIFKFYHSYKTLTNYNDSGNASRFFKSIIYQPKASRTERNKGLDALEEKEFGFSGGANGAISRDEEYSEGQGIGLNRVQKTKNHHPTVKPIALIEYLINMVSRSGAVVLDPFGGSGTTALACIEAERDCIIIEREKEYIDIIIERVKNHKPNKPNTSAYTELELF